VELLRQSFDADNKIISRQKMSVPWGQVDAVSGELNMQGPGAVSLWSTQGGSSLFQPAETPTAQVLPAATQLTHTHVRFDTSLTGKFANRVIVRGKSAR
jgi:hypothetical protein